MENTRICPNCGANNKTDSNFCVSCGTKIEQNDVETFNNQSVKSEASNAKMLGIISLVLYFGGTTILSIVTSFLSESFSVMFSSLAGLCPILGIIVMIIGRVKYPTNKFLKVVMWIIIGSIIFSLVATVIFMIWCYVACTTINTSGCY